MVRATLRIGAGVGLIILGIIGFILPVMPGWPFFIPGLALLADYFPPARRLHTWIIGRIDWGKEKAGFKRKPPAAEPSE